MKLEAISRNKNGDYYFIYKIPVKRGIRGKNKAIVDELIIVGMNKDRVREYCEKQGIDIERICERTR